MESSAQAFGHGRLSGRRRPHLDRTAGSASVVCRHRVPVGCLGSHPADQSIFAYTQNDLSMAGGCTGCLGPCKIVLLKFNMFNGSALISSPGWEAFGALRPTESLYGFSVLSGEAIALGDALDANNAICQSGNNDWGSTTNVVSGTAQEVMNVIKMFDLSVAPQMMRELELGIEQAEECPSTWNMIAITRLFQYPTTPGELSPRSLPREELYRWAVQELFRDCDDMAYVTYEGKHCTTVEALLLTGYLYHGEHIYQASAVMLLILARVMPRKVLRTFNMLLLRWHVNPKEGTLSHALSCTWYTASKENHQLAGATPVSYIMHVFSKQRDHHPWQADLSWRRFTINLERLVGPLHISTRCLNDLCPLANMSVDKETNCLCYYGSRP